jgi:hypothetical protein
MLTLQSISGDRIKIWLLLLLDRFMEFTGSLCTWDRRFTFGTGRGGRWFFLVIFFICIRTICCHHCHYPHSPTRKGWRKGRKWDVPNHRQPASTNDRMRRGKKKGRDAQSLDCDYMSTTHLNV